jgi:hypothetical protein
LRTLGAAELSSKGIKSSICFKPTITAIARGEIKTHADLMIRWNIVLRKKLDHPVFVAAFAASNPPLRRGE